MSDDESNVAMLSDKNGTFGLDATEYENEEELTTVTVDRLKASLDIFQKLNWTKVSLSTVPSENGDVEMPMLILRPVGWSLNAKTDAGISIAPWDDSDRDYLKSDDSDDEDDSPEETDQSAESESEVER